MDLLFNVLLYGVGGFLGLILLLFILALLFGKRIDKQWEYEAEFRDAKGREIAEFEIESSRIAKEQEEYSLKVKFRCRHPALTTDDRVQVFVDELLVLAGVVSTNGRVRLGASDLVDTPAEPRAGQICYVRHNDAPLMQQALRKD